jgi:hypothetical protein
MIPDFGIFIAMAVRGYKSSRVSAYLIATAVSGYKGYWFSAYL